MPRFSAMTRLSSLSDARSARAAIWEYLLKLEDVQTMGSCVLCNRVDQEHVDDKWHGKESEYMLVNYEF